MIDDRPSDRAVTRDTVGKIGFRSLDRRGGRKSTFRKGATGIVFAILRRYRPCWCRHGAGNLRTEAAGRRGCSEWSAGHRSLADIIGLLLLCGPPVRRCSRPDGRIRGRLIARSYTDCHNAAALDGHRRDVQY